MKSIVLLLISVFAMNTYAASVGPVACDKIEALFRSGGITSDYSFNELLKIDFGKNALEWNSDDFKAFKDLAMKCRHPNTDESYFSSTVDDSIKWIKEASPKKMVEKQKRDNTSGSIKELSSRASGLLKNIDPENSKQLEDILASIKTLELQPDDPNYTDAFMLSVQINNALSEYSQKKEMDKLNAEEKARQAKFAAMNKKQQAEAETAAQKARKENSIAFSKCDKIRGNLQGRMKAIEQIKKKYGSAASNKMQNEGVKKLQAELYEIDKLSPKIDELGCEQFYAH